MKHKSSEVCEIHNLKRRPVITGRAAEVTEEPNEGALFAGKCSATYTLQSSQQQALVRDNKV